MATPMDRLLTLAEVHDRTGESVARLGRWCATGKLACERAGGEWLLPEPQLRLVHELREERSRIVATRRAIGMLVPLRHVTFDLASRVERTLGLRAGAASVTRLALDGRDYLLALWPNDPTITRARAVAQLADDLGADLLEGDSAAN